MSYTIGDELEKFRVACSQSKMSITVMSTPSGLLRFPDFAVFDDSVVSEAWLELFTEDALHVGTYRFDVREEDLVSGNIRVTQVVLEVREPYKIVEKEINFRPLYAWV